MRLAGLLLLTAGAAWIALTILLLLGHGLSDLYETAGSYWAIGAYVLLITWVVLGTRRTDL